VTCSEIEYFRVCAKMVLNSSHQVGSMARRAAGKYEAQLSVVRMGCETKGRHIIVVVLIMWGWEEEVLYGYTVQMDK
jgi:hypothetical protein